MIPQVNENVRLAGQAASLSTELYSVQEKCQHDSISQEISTIADELARLSTTLWHLNDAINTDPAQYTEAFNEDLKEITTELACVFEEISECCAGLQSADSNTNVVSWFFKKGRVAKLLKHLGAMHSTALVMRLTLWHSKDYGVHTSDRVAESDPHTMREDRAILESVLAQNRNAILDLHSITTSLDRVESSKVSRTLSRAGDHYRALTESTGVEIPPIPDVLPLSKAESGEPAANDSSSRLERTFSKRGVRLGVHMSILDLSAHEAPNGLKKKWIQQADIGQQLDHVQALRRGGLTALPELSRISEVDTACGSLTNLNASNSTPEVVVPLIPESPSSDSLRNTPDVPFNTPAGSTTQHVRDLSPSSEERESKVGGKLRRMFSRISLSNIQSPLRSKDRGFGDSSETTTSSTSKGKERDTESYERCDGVLTETPSNRPNTRRLSLYQENKSGRRTLLEIVKQKFERSPLTTPDVEKEFEYGKV